MIEETSKRPRKYIKECAIAGAVIWFIWGAIAGAVQNGIVGFFLYGIGGIPMGLFAGWVFAHYGGLVILIGLIAGVIALVNWIISLF